MWGIIPGIMLVCVIAYKFLDQLNLLIERMSSGKISAFFVFVVAVLPFLLIKQIFINTPDKIQNQEWKLYSFLVILAVIIGTLYLFWEG